MDEEHAEVLRSIFWDMTVIEFATETYTKEITVEVPTDDSTDEDGMVEEPQTVERTRLVISISVSVNSSSILHALLKCATILPYSSG